MWSEAAVEIQNVSRMRLQIANDTYMQTFNPVSFGGLAGEARKIPQPDGSTIIQASFACRYCGDLPDSALKLFNLSVQNSGRGFPEPYKAPSWSDEIKKTPSAEPASEPSFSPALIRYN
jgi:hypothetical protein